MRRPGAFALCILLLLAGCGQRGGLYLPDQRSTAVPQTEPTKTKPPEPAANPADEDKKKNK